MSPTIEKMRMLLDVARFITPELEQQRVATLAAFDAERELAAWRCLRCESPVVSGRCKCTSGPSPWEPVNAEASHGEKGKDHE